MGNAYLIEVGSAFQLSRQHLHCMMDWTILYSFPGFWWRWYFVLCSVGIAFCVYTLLSLVPHCTVWLSSWIFLCLAITVIILILLILAFVWLWTRDDWILCSHNLFYCYLLGKDGVLSFLNSKWHLGNWRVFYYIELQVQGHGLWTMYKNTS